MCVQERLWYKEFHVVTSCSTDQGGDQEWRGWNANQAIHNSVEHCSLGLLSPFLKGVPTKLVEHFCNAACPLLSCPFTKRAPRRWTISSFLMLVFE